VAVLGSEPYDPDNLLDRLSSGATLEFFYRHTLARERRIVQRRLGLRAGGSHRRFSGRSSRSTRSDRAPARPVSDTRFC
jgi:hypothetical protein